jgi:hypothetical protein
MRDTAPNCWASPDRYATRIVAALICRAARGAQTRRGQSGATQLVDQLPEDELRPALELIRSRVAEHGGQGRDLPFFASFEAEPDLAERAEDSA